VSVLSSMGILPKPVSVFRVVRVIRVHVRSFRPRIHTNLHEWMHPEFVTIGVHSWKTIGLVKNELRSAFRVVRVFRGSIQSIHHADWKPQSTPPSADSGKTRLPLRISLMAGDGIRRSRIVRIRVLQPVAGANGTLETMPGCQLGIHPSKACGVHPGSRLPHSKCFCPAPGDWGRDAPVG